MKRTLLFLITPFLLSFGVPLMAHKRHFTFSYDWFTPFKNERELELWWTQSDHGEAISMLEFEYGITGNYVIAPYFTFEHGGEKANCKDGNWKTASPLAPSPSTASCQGSMEKSKKNEENPMKPSSKSSPLICPTRTGSSPPTSSPSANSSEGRNGNGNMPSALADKSSGTSGSGLRRSED